MARADVIWNNVINKNYSLQRHKTKKIFALVSLVMVSGIRKLRKVTIFFEEGKHHGKLTWILLSVLIAYPEHLRTEPSHPKKKKKS